MHCYYTLTDKDLQKLGIEKLENASSYFAYQWGWSGTWEGIYGITHKNNIRYDIEIVNGKNFNEEMESYIWKNCTCKEY